MIVAAAVRRYIKENHGMMVSKEFMEALPREVQKVIDRAAERAKGNGRKTLKACDL